MDGNRITESGPVWEIATLFPEQGTWSLQEYLALDTNNLVEFSHGHIEVLPVPSIYHQFLVAFLFEALKQYVTQHELGRVLFAPTKVRLWENHIREPDVLFISNAKLTQRTEQFWFGADLVIEVVSPDDPARDLEKKRSDYARAGIPEYWIADPRFEHVIVLTLDGDHYVEHGTFSRGEHATSVLLDGFTVSVDAVFDSAE